MKTRSFAALVPAFFACAIVFTAMADVEYAGVNLSGAEFGQDNLPGTFGSDYTYPTTQEVNYYKGKGMNFIRLPFRWERLQHTNNAVLDPTELGRLQSFVSYATGQGMSVLLDPHNFMRYYPLPRSDFETATTGLVGSSVPNSVFTNFWSQVAATFKANSRVMFGLNNEPDSMPTEQLLASENAAINAIRQTGATNVIFVPGNGYTGAWTWTSSYSYGTPNSEVLTNIVDPDSNFVFEAHQYLDSDGSGTTTNIVDATIGADRLVDFTQWLRANHYKGFIGEFAVADVTIGGAGLGGPALTNMLNYISSNSDVLIGWAFWGGGPWWGSGALFAVDPLNIGTKNQSDQPVMGVLKHFFPLPSPALQLLAGPKFEFTAPQGFIYQPQGSTNLGGGVWTNYGASFSGGGVATNFTFQTTPNTAGFYRVNVSHTP